MESIATKRVEGGRRLRGLVRSQKPLITIVTVVFRARKELDEILNNVFEHDPNLFELIVVDGGSDDGTVDLLQQWDDRIEYWLSEPDEGIFDAMNKAQTFATGDFFFHLNAGDKLLCVPATELHAALRENVDIVSFRVSIDGTRQFVPSGGFMLKLKNTLHHQGSFYRRETFLPYDLRYRKLADYDLNQRLAIRGAKIRTYDKVVAFHASGGAGDAIQGYSEHAAILRANHGWFWMTLSIALSEWKGIKSRRKAAFKRWLNKGRASS